MMTNGGKSRLMAEINVTPFVDVMLVLLIIFMVTAPMMTHGVKVDTPQTTHEKIDVDPRSVMVALDSSGNLFVNEAKIQRSEIRERLPQLLNVKEVDEVYLKADKSLPYGVVMEVMASIRDAGIEKIGMVTEPSAVAQKVGE